MNIRTCHLSSKLNADCGCVAHLINDLVILLWSNTVFPQDVVALGSNYLLNIRPMVVAMNVPVFEEMVLGWGSN